MTGIAADSKFQLGLYLGVPPSAGGMFQYAQSMLEALTSLDHRYVITVVYSDNEWVPILERFGVAGIALRYAQIGQFMADVVMVLGLPGPKSRILGRLFNPIVRQLIRINCKTWIFPAQESLSYQLPVQSVCTIHDLMHRYEPTFPEVSKGFRYLVRENRFRNIAKYCNLILVDSKVGLKHVVESYAVSDKKILPLPYVAPSYIRRAQERHDFDGFYNLPKQFLFYPAQFWQHKNHKRLIDALQIAIKSFPDISLVLSGGFRQSYENIRDYVEFLGLTAHVHFVGYVPDEDLRGFYLRARALVMPTFFGPTNIPPLEALAVGCPVITSEIYGMNEQLSDAAIFFNPLCTTDIAKKIITIWESDSLVEDLRKKGFIRDLAYGQKSFTKLLQDGLNKLHE